MVLMAGGLGLVLAFQDPLYRLGRNIEIYGRVLQELATNYVDEPDLDKLTTRAIESMLEALDPYTNFYSAVDVTQGQLEQSGRYAGIGVLLERVAGRTVCRKVFSGGPAQKAGLYPGDLVLEIDHQSTHDLPLERLQEFLRGMPGTSLELTVETPRTRQRRTVRITRAELEISAIPYAGLLPDDIGYIALSQFTRGCAEAFKQELIRLKSQAPLKGLIIDLRGNPGGLLQEALEILNLFVPKGELLLETRGRMGEANQKYIAMLHPFEPTLPLAILIDEQSASASEIVAGTLQDLDRAVILGHRSFGKGLVQVVRPLVENTQMKITVSRYYTPSGRCIQRGQASDRVFRTRAGRIMREATGITPDLELPTKLPIQLKSRVEPYVFLFSAYLPAPADTLNLQVASAASALAVLDSIARYPEVYEEAEERALRGMQQQFKRTDSVYGALEQTLAAFRAYRLAALREGMETLQFLLGRELYYGLGGEALAYRYVTRYDPWVQEAQRLLSDGARYGQILKP